MWVNLMALEALQKYPCIAHCGAELRQCCAVSVQLYAASTSTWPGEGLLFAGTEFLPALFNLRLAPLLTAVG